MRTSLAISLLCALTNALVAQRAATPDTARTRAALSRIPIHFIENRGVYPDEVAYYVKGADKTLFFTESGVTFALKNGQERWTVKLEFLDGRPGVRPDALERQQAVFSYFTGCEADWKTGLRSFAKIVYGQLWPGVDLVYHGTVNRLKYEFRVAPGADPSRIRLHYRGAARVRVTAVGALRVETPAGVFEDAPPVAWQEIDGKRVAVKMAYSLDGDGRFHFDLGDYDRAKPLVLDPALLVYCGYIGGAKGDRVNDIAVDSLGNAYVTGCTSSDERSFPVRVGPDLSFNLQSTPNSGFYFDAFVAKVSASGDRLVYCGYISGSRGARGTGIAVDAMGCAFVTGMTFSDELSFPVRAGPDLTWNGGCDAFVAKVNPAGTGLVYCGYVGGTWGDGASGIAVDGAGSAYITGWTGSDELTFPVCVGPDLTFNDFFWDDAFVAKVNAKGTGLVYCGYIGGASWDDAAAIAVDHSGRAYVVGGTDSSEATFPVRVGPILKAHRWDGFVARVDTAGTKLEYCGYIGGKDYDEVVDIAVDAVGHAYVVGDTMSGESSFPVCVGPDLTYNGGWGDAFVAKINATGSAMIYCGYVGGTAAEWGTGIAVDDVGSAILSGCTDSSQTSFPVKVGPDLSINGRRDAFVARVNPDGRALDSCGYLGGLQDDWATAVAIDPSRNIYLSGYTFSDEKSFPVTKGPGNTRRGTHYHNEDAFVAKIEMVLLDGVASARPGSTVTLNLTATDDVARRYCVGSSFLTGKIEIGSRSLDLGLDGLLVASVTGAFPTVFSGYRGWISRWGRATGEINIPPMPGLIGLSIYSAFVTLDALAPHGIKSISNTVTTLVER